MEESDKKPLKKTQKMQLLKQQMEDLEKETESEDSPIEEVLEKPPSFGHVGKTLKKPKKEKPPKEDKRKTKERTDKQKEHFEKLQELCKLKVAERKALNKIKVDEDTRIQKEELEKKIVEKAIKLKKKQIKKQEILDDLSDEEPTIEKVKQFKTMTKTPVKVNDPYEEFKKKFNF